MKNLEKSLEFDKKLSNYYPLINFNDELVKYNPEIHELEKSESAVYFDFEEQKIKGGIIESVEYSDPMKYPVYIINGKPHMYYSVWPKVEKNKANLSEKEVRCKESADFLKTFCSHAVDDD
jgi:hypothetical protein